ncbi:conserved hypothetical protein [Alteracholeplasma palmae J233]|uniref:Phosphotransferase system EIIC domain-containing protein n=1 Tax=Alteracholeplasma palmae (strain ATCC 49389 / J233) TaxID=1318466 RepID=U4KLE4_ALTPJ|nr:PTS sugar transporter subunit IIC [Alteracholeplasma palmae]CCV64642.1 conserved hypothetical protein [Alteracholeplasma palmae J233]
MKKTILTTLNGMTYGIFATIVAGTILKQLGELIGFEVLATSINTRLSLLTGVGIGISMAMSLKLKGLKFIILSIAGGISTSFVVDFSKPGFYDINAPLSNNPITVYLVVLLTYIVIEKLFKKEKAYDLFLIPLVGILIAVLNTYIVSYPIERLMTLIYFVIEKSLLIEPYTTSALIALIFGVLITVPFVSSAGIAIAVFSKPYMEGNTMVLIAMGAAVVGTTAQMIGLAYQSRKNNIGSILSIGLASSMFQFKNIVKKPVIWLPTLFISFILGPINYLIFSNSIFKNTPQGAGMGSSGLVGQLQTLSVNNYSLMSVLFVVSQIMFPLILIIIIDYLCIKRKIYLESDFNLETDL